MSKVRINDLARELEVKSKQILDALESMGMAEGKTHSSSIEAHEAERVRGYFERGSRPAGSGGAAGSRSEQENRPKIDLSNISKPGDVLKAILAKKQETERQAQFPGRPAAPAVVVRPPAGGVPAGGAVKPTAIGVAAPPSARVAPAPPVVAKPEPRKIVPQPRPA